MTTALVYAARSYFAARMTPLSKWLKSKSTSTSGQEALREATDTIETAMQEDEELCTKAERESGANGNTTIKKIKTAIGKIPDPR